MTNKTLSGLGAEFGVSIADSFKKRAVYFHNMDCLEYLSADQLVVADRVDEFLTVLWDKDLEKIVGFKLKGFHAIFVERILPLKSVCEDDFHPIIDTLKNIVTKIGEEMFPDSSRQNAYKNVIRFAKNEGVDSTFDEKEVLQAVA